MIKESEIACNDISDHCAPEKSLLSRIKKTKDATDTARAKQKELAKIKSTVTKSSSKSSTDNTTITSGNVSTTSQKEETDANYKATTEIDDLDPNSEEAIIFACAKNMGRLTRLISITMVPLCPLTNVLGHANHHSK